MYYILRIVNLCYAHLLEHNFMANFYMDIKQKQNKKKLYHLSKLELIWFLEGLKFVALLILPKTRKETSLSKIVL